MALFDDQPDFMTTRLPEWVQMQDQPTPDVSPLVNFLKKRPKGSAGGLGSVTGGIGQSESPAHGMNAESL